MRADRRARRRRREVAAPSSPTASSPSRNRAKGDPVDDAPADRARASPTSAARRAPRARKRGASGGCGATATAASARSATTRRHRARDALADRGPLRRHADAASSAGTGRGRGLHVPSAAAGADADRRGRRRRRAVPPSAPEPADGERRRQRARERAAAPTSRVQGPDVPWVELFAVFVVSHVVGDFLLQTEWQATHKRGGLGGDPRAPPRAALARRSPTRSAFVPALVWLAGELGAGGAPRSPRASSLPHLVQDDGRLLGAYVRRVKHTEPAPGMLMLAVDQSFHLVVLFGARRGRGRMTRLRRRHARRRGAARGRPRRACSCSTGLGRRLELGTVDARFELRGEQPPPDDIVRRRRSTTRRSTSSSDDRWPFSRNRFAAVLEQRLRRRPARDRLRRPVHRGVRRPARRQPPDRGVARRPATSSSARPRSATTAIDARVRRRRGPASTRAPRSATGCFPEDPGGVVRRMPEQIDGLDTLAVAAVKRLGPARAGRPLGGDGAWIDFAGPARPRPARVTSPTSRRATSPASRFKDKIVVIGATAPVAPGRAPDVRGRGDVMPGPEIHANAIATLLRGAPLRSTGTAARRRCSRSCSALLAPLRGARCVRPWVGLRRGRRGGRRSTRSPRSSRSTAAGSSRWSAPLVALARRLRRARCSCTGSPATFERARTRDVFARFVPDAVVDQVLDARHRGGRPAARRRADGRDRAVQRPARLHDASPRRASRSR